LKNLINLIFVLILPQITYSQDFNVNSISEDLKKDAYAVVRHENTKVEFLSFDKVNYQYDYAVTVLDESGLDFAKIPVFYSPNEKVKNFNAVMYNADGSEMKKLKSRDAKDVSAYDGFSLFIDTRVKYFDIVPISYPFTIQYFIETETSNTISIPGWHPIGDYNLSVENSTYTLVNQTQIPIRKLEENFEKWNVQNNSSGNTTAYSVQNIHSIQDEIYSPSLKNFIPYAKFAPTDFELEGVKGHFENWKEFGKWYYENLLYDKQELSEQEKQTAINLVKGVENTKEKIRILYQYMQNKTRYINVSIGIGGWEPFPAAYVSDKSYGDCKALSNYMVSLLKAVGIQGYHTVVFAGREKKLSFNRDFASLEGNHMIVNVPLENETIWLECTSQQTAFNYLGNFTDGRFALSVTPEGGEIVKTQDFPTKNNKIVNSIKGEILPNGDLKADFSIQNSGLEYDFVYSVDFENSQSQKNFLNQRMGDLPNLKIKEYQFNNDRENAVFQTDLKIESQQFAKVFGNNMTVNLIPAARLKSNFKKDDGRSFPFEIRFGYNDSTEIELKIPAGYRLNTEFEPVIYQSEFGNYVLLVKKENENTLKIQRTVTLNDGTFPKEKFNDFVEFERKISSFDNSKILLEKI
jgi:hypothetical protein